jgi:hypothetical protein
MLLPVGCPVPSRLPGGGNFVYYFAATLLALRRPLRPTRRSSLYVVLAAVVYSLCLPGPAAAGHYMMSAQYGGKVYVTPSIPPFPMDYTNGPNGYGGGYGGGGSVNCSGQITTVFTWVPNDPDNDPPPDNVVVTETCTASWSGYDVVPPTGSCNNGLGFDAVYLGPVPGVPSPPFYSASWSSSGTRYSVHPGEDTPGSNTLTLHCNPSAEASSFIFASASVYYTSSVTPVLVNLAGVTVKQDDGSRHILIGQGCTASMSAGIFTLSNYSWNIPTGSTFKEYVAHGQLTPPPDGSKAVVYYLTQYDLWEPAPHFYWLTSISGGGSGVSRVETVTGTADAYDSQGRYAGRVTASRQVTVWNPIFSCDVTTDNVWVFLDSSSQMRLQAGRLNFNGYPFGIAWTGAVKPPPPVFWSLQGLGKWAFIQLVKPERTITTTDSVVHTWSINDRWGLDGNYPLAPPQDNNIHDDSTSGFYDDGLYDSWNDSPSEPLNDNRYNVHIGDESFMTYMVYCPADIGNGHQWVPLNAVDWSWSANVTRPANGWAYFGGGTWPASAGGSITVLYNGPVCGHPTWDEVMKASAPWIPPL